MSDCNINISFTGSAEEILNKAKAAVESQGGSFEGDLNSGRFHVSLMSNTVAGSYTVTDNQLQLNITEKPMFVPCNAIESFLLKKLS
jgi:hypothetical protein